MRTLGRWFLRLLAVPAAAAIACAAAPAAGTPPARIPAAVTVSGVWIGGLTTEVARARLRSAFAQPLTFRDGRRQWSEPVTRFARPAPVNDVIEIALRAKPASDLRIAIKPDRAAIDWYVARTDRQDSRAPRDAELVGLTPSLAPQFSSPEVGRRLDRAAARKAIVAAVGWGERAPIRLRFRPVRPAITAENYGPVVVIRRESKVLTLYDGARLVRQVGIATGTAEYPTPLGTFSIVDMQYNPWWYPPASDWAEGLKPVPPGPGNPLGTRWMGLNVYGVGMHGTPDAASIGYSASHGCIRMHIADAEWLFTQVHVGTPVVIVSA